MKLNYESLKHPENWAGYHLPTFDPAEIAQNTKAKPQWLHFGAGNIFRIFPAVLCQRLIEAGEMDTGVICCEGYDDEIITKCFRPYDNLSVAVTLCADGSIEKEVVGSMVESLTMLHDGARVREIFETPSLQMVSFTITEKGYALRNPAGELYPVVAADMENGPEGCRHFMSQLAALCVARFHACGAPLALVSMDNCSHNGEKLQSAITIFSLVLSLALSLGLFMFLPTFVAGLFRAESALLHNLIEGVIKILIFFAYLFLCSRQKDVHRIFQYHGAEHKTIFCYEAGLPLTVENARVQPRHHPRCGTSFLFVVIVVSILFSSIAFTQVEWQNLWVRIGVHLLMLIPIVGLTYEFNRFVGRHDNAVTRILSAPGMWLQNFTTFEPDDSMLEVAIESLKLVLPQEQGKDKW